MESPIQHGERYSERKLSELLTNATDTLMPGPGFQLSIEGLPLPLLTQSELEAHLGHTFDLTAKPLKLSLQYDPKLDHVTMKELHIPLAHADGHASLFRTEQLGYLSAITLGKVVYRTKKSVFSPTDIQRLTETITGGFALSDTSNPSVYNQWRNNLRQRSSSWRLVESIEIPEAYTTDMVQFSTLRREEHYDLKKRVAEDTRRFTRSIVHIDSGSGKRHHSEQSLEQDAVQDAKPIIYLRTFTQEDSSPFYEIEDTIRDEQLTAVDITEDIYHETANALRDIQMYRAQGA